MEKLELKHLAGYLPYGLEMLYNNDFISPRKRKLSVDGYQFLVGNAKPILCPLSDLTKEIEVNGKKFVPEEYLNANCKKYYLPEDWNAGLFIQSENIMSVNYAVVQKLLEWHFDIYGLITEGLAIDINTLNP